MVYGHTPREAAARMKWTLGIDTSCVTGGALTACVLPERTLVQLPAREKYCAS